MTTTTENVISTFSSLLGEARVKTDEATRKNFALGHLLPECVVSPGAEEEVAAVLRRAAEADLAVVPCRNGTKLGDILKSLDEAKNNICILVFEEELKIVFDRNDGLVTAGYNTVKFDTTTVVQQCNGY